MAANLKLVFDGNSGKKVSFSYPLADITAAGSQVKTLMENIVANGDIYADAPQALSKAEFLVNDVIPIDIE